MDFGAISRDFERKILPPRKIFENFGPKSAPNRAKSHAAQHADARNRCWGPLRVVSKLRTTRRHGLWRDLARFRTQNFAARARENFGPKSVPNRTQSHAAQHAYARNRCCIILPLRVVKKLRTTRRHGFRRDLARFRTQNFEFSKIISVRNQVRIARNLTRHSMLTLATDVGDL